VADDKGVDLWGLVNKVMYAAVVGIFVFLWSTNARVIRLETQREATVEKLAKIEKTVEKIYDLLMKEHSNP